MPTSPGSGSVNFRIGDMAEYNEERKKYLTAKYGAHQMKLIRKRLAVENWLDQELRILYDVKSDSDTYDCIIDVDDVLDMDTEVEKRQFIQKKLSNVRKSPEVVHKFISELLVQADTL